LRELGFSETDQPDEEELARIIELKRQLTVTNQVPTTPDDNRNDTAVDTANPDPTEAQTDIEDMPVDITERARRLLTGVDRG
jgi:hypothetical protein